MKWQLRELWFWQTVKLIDGSTQRGGQVMGRRLPHGGWQYRSLTEAESFADFQASVW